MPVCRDPADDPLATGSGPGVLPEYDYPKDIGRPGRGARLSRSSGGPVSGGEAFADTDRGRNAPASRRRSGAATSGSSRRCSRGRSEVPRVRTPSPCWGRERNSTDWGSVVPGVSRDPPWPGGVNRMSGRLCRRQPVTERRQTDQGVLL